MKKVILGIIFFIVVSLFSLAINFPMEAVVNNYLKETGKKTGLVFDYRQGKFSLTKIELEDFEVFRKGNLLARFGSVFVSVGWGKISIRSPKDNPNVRVDLEPSKTNFFFREFPAVSDGEKYFKKIIVSGNMLYNNKEKIGTGKFRINLLESLQPAIAPSDIMAVVEVRTTAEEVTLDVVDLQGNNLRGDGKITIETNKQNFEESKINGLLKVRVASMPPMKIGIKGTINNIQVAPQ